MRPTDMDQAKQRRAFLASLTKQALSRLTPTCGTRYSGQQIAYQLL